MDGRTALAGHPLEPFELGDSPFRGTSYAGRVRHVALLEGGDRLHIFFSAIGDAPERIFHTTMDLSGEWRQWKVKGGIAGAQMNFVP